MYYVNFCLIFKYKKNLIYNVYHLDNSVQRLRADQLFERTLDKHLTISHVPSCCPGRTDINSFDGHFFTIPLLLSCEGFVSFRLTDTSDPTDGPDINGLGLLEKPNIRRIGQAFFSLCVCCQSLAAIRTGC